METKTAKLEESDNDIQTYSELVLSILKYKKCIQIPTRILFQVVKYIEPKSISFSFKNIPGSKWTVLHCLYCNCH